MKQYRHLFQFGTFYRLKSPFKNNVSAWMVVSEDKKEAVVGWYRVLNGINLPCERLRLQGLDASMAYEVNGDGPAHYGDELMYAGLVTTDVSSGQADKPEEPSQDFESRLYILKAVKGGRQ